MFVCLSFYRRVCVSVRLAAAVDDERGGGGGTAAFADCHHTEVSFCHLPSYRPRYLTSFLTSELDLVFGLWVVKSKF